ncbi:DUF1007 family protein [Neptunicoccus cionae]|uniref:DUF1007 family protein n=1 Tax=Neptunicoccus cionae TaxID=2035344 RepID=UPI000C784F92|nr:DUF1007 family protein [Amylibacter cionae]PLS21794.1 DUF1007 domain-containing protein [Amylibacter cionae]
MKRFALTAVLSLTPLPAVTHPHIYVDAGINFLFDDNGRLAALRVFWSYDEFYSLLQLEELELDQDGDGTITVEEQEKLAGFDTNWVEGFEGDLYVTHNDAKVALGAPMEAGAALQNGRLLTWHIRPLLDRIEPSAGETIVKVYDPTFYSAYTLDHGVEVIDNPDCSLAIKAADLPKAYDAVESLLYGENSAQYEGDESFPEVGELFADTVYLECVSS